MYEENDGGHFFYYMGENDGGHAEGKAVGYR